jgi:hypothetical protein
MWYIEGLLVLFGDKKGLGCPFMDFVHTCETQIGLHNF